MGTLNASATRARYRRGVKRALTSCAAWAGLDRLGRAIQPGRLLVVCYHGVGRGDPAAEHPWLLVPVEQFREQVGYLTSRYHVRPIDAALADLRAGGLRRPTACITFDDGYRSNHDLAWPILEEHGAPATVYLTTGLMGTTRVIWPVEVDLLFRQTAVDGTDLHYLGTRHFDGRRSSRPSAARRAKAILKRVSPAERGELLARLRSDLRIEHLQSAPEFEIMSWDQARRMEASGWVRFGPHTVNHEILSRLDDASLESEIARSIRDVHTHLEEPSATFAYPNGSTADFDARAEAVLRREGARAALTTIPGLNSQRVPPFAIRRHVIGPDLPLAEFKLLVSGALPVRRLHSAEAQG